MAGLLKRAWWMLFIRGIAGILFGVLILRWPELTLVTLISLFGAYALVDGIFAVVGAIMYRQEHARWWLVLLGGLASMVAGILAFLWPGVTALVLLIFIAARALVTGIFDIITAIRLRREIEGEWFLILTGAAAILFGSYTFIAPGAGALAIIWLIATYTIVTGVFLVVLAFRVRDWEKKLDQLRPT